MQKLHDVPNIRTSAQAIIRTRTACILSQYTATISVLPQPLVLSRSRPPQRLSHDPRTSRHLIILGLATTLRRVSSRSLSYLPHLAPTITHSSSFKLDLVPNMPTNTEFHPLAADAFSVSIYVPVHYEYSQVEYVAPFLEQYKGSKVFVYKWNGRRDKMIEYYSTSPEYTNAQLGVYDFTLQNIISCILDEPPEKKVVFLLTASMAYCFGEYQRNLLKSVKSTLKRWATN
ncbi:hypothetical protein BCR44DRAFT_1059926 [Catenaria anguillulae PL171]|uniref:Uncharacterized protein n=1 Tax=Catenaria anguillulae PL171 TaxID=765915 RepID=A0A1Y2HS79_9FUNG|nr:hypothetical protein BCR44DRAFT_1059926 [Catenaria anguillulae PL171]